VYMCVCARVCVFLLEKTCLVPFLGLSEAAARSTSKHS
jgi:hypothetical protein